jgi:hypothetical protein
MAAWSAIEERERLPDEWCATTGPDGPAARMSAEVRPGGPRQSDLLRLEWPPHPSATSYLVHFRRSDGRKASPIEMRGTVFLYDLDANAMRLPMSFVWEVSALLPDGSEVVTPARRVTVGSAP